MFFFSLPSPFVLIVRSVRGKAPCELHFRSFGNCRRDPFALKALRFICFLFVACDLKPGGKFRYRPEFSLMYIKTSSQSWFLLFLFCFLFKKLTKWQVLNFGHKMLWNVAGCESGLDADMSRGQHVIQIAGFHFGQRLTCRWATLNGLTFSNKQRVHQMQTIMAYKTF